jgi:type I restriction enzyme S subunit
MIQSNIEAVLNGYKKTEIGVYPDDWEVFPIQKLCRTPITYGIVQCGPHIDNGVPYIRVSDMNSTQLDVNGMLRTSKEIAASFIRSKVDDGDIVYALRGKLGEVRIVPPSLAGANLTQGTARIAPKKTFSNDYVLWALQSTESIRQAYKEAKGSTFIELTLAKLQSIQIPVPKTIKEQTAIANALSDVDALLSELEKLIAKKQAIKTATMQQLLTGKTRLPAFATYGENAPEGKKKGQQKGTKPSELGEIPEDWNSTFASEIIRFFGGFGFSSRLATNNGIRWLKIANVGLNEMKWDADSYLSESLSSSFKDYLLKVNDVVMALTRPLLNDKLKVARLKNNDLPALLNQRVAKLVPKDKNNLDYIYYVVQRAEFIAAMNLAMAGTDPPNIGTTALGNINILIPSSPDEQKAIATVLSDIDEEIQALEKRLSKTRQIKQGMMQELLTGKTRLPFDKN